MASGECSTWLSISMIGRQALVSSWLSDRALAFRDPHIPRRNVTPKLSRKPLGFLTCHGTSLLVHERLVAWPAESPHVRCPTAPGQFLPVPIEQYRIITDFLNPPAVIYLLGPVRIVLD